MDLERIDVRIDPDYPHFGLIGEPTPHPQHPNQQKGLNHYVSVVNLDTGERCFKKLYANGRGLHFKHTGYSPMYLSDFTENAVVFPFQFVRVSPGAADLALAKADQIMAVEGEASREWRHSRADMASYDAATGEQVSFIYLPDDTRIAVGGGGDVAEQVREIVEAHNASLKGPRP